MTMRTLAAALLGLAIVSLAPAPANASCGLRDRIVKDSTECLTGWWEDRTWPWPGTKGGVTNECDNIGTMKVKINVGGGVDKTIYERPGGGQTRYDWRDGYTHSQSCCHDWGPCHATEVGSVTDLINWIIPGDISRYGQVRLDGCHSADKFCKKTDMDKVWFCRKSFKAAKRSDGECGEQVRGLPRLRLRRPLLRCKVPIAATATAGGTACTSGASPRRTRPVKSKTGANSSGRPSASSSSVA